MHRELPVSHPFFERIVFDGSTYHVTLSSAFPVSTFNIRAVQSPWDGLEVAADLGVKHRKGGVDWIRGSGNTLDEAVEDALVMFANLVVHPEDTVASDFVFRMTIE